VGDDQRRALRRLPQIDRLLGEPAIRQAAVRLGPAPLRELAREALEEIRRAIRDESLSGSELERRLEALPEQLEIRARERSRSSLRAVINATGVLLHTNLGRSPLSAAALERVREAAGGYSTLEYDLGGRRRGSRSSHLERLFSALFPGRATHVVNNNAAALTLALNALAAGREALVSRGELVEIGGSFRIPEILAASGVRLREVGTTNRTRLSDYERALGRDTAVILKVHPSNYRVVGFTASVRVRDLAPLARRRRVPLVVDQGSGLLAPLAKYGVADEPTVGDFLREGADLVAFSGDKLLGGPQAGILVGRPDLIRRLRQHPLSRALRVDKMAIAALEATLEAHVRGAALEEVPVLRLLSRSADDLRRRAEALARAIRETPGAAVEVDVARSVGRVGGGASPSGALPSWRIGLTPAPAAGVKADRRGGSAALAALERALREAGTPVIGVLARNRLWLDLRSVPPEQDDELLSALCKACRALAPGADRCPPSAR
jgi:L-seryl-tRNA(Ser) seleniumtransferase